MNDTRPLHHPPDGVSLRSTEPAPACAPPPRTTLARLAAAIECERISAADYRAPDEALDYAVFARAAVEALRELSDAMLKGFDHKRRHAAIWSRMCDAILQETPE